MDATEQTSLGSGGCHGDCLRASRRSRKGSLTRYACEAFIAERAILSSQQLTQPGAETVLWRFVLRARSMHASLVNRWSFHDLGGSCSVETVKYLTHAYPNGGCVLHTCRQSFFWRVMTPGNISRNANRNSKMHIVTTYELIHRQSTALTA